MPKKPTTTPAFKDVVAALSKPGRSRHSTAYLWLRRNRPQVERQIADHGINWQDFAAALAASGIVNRKGEPFSGAAVKQTWFRLGQDMKKQPPRVVRKPVPAARGREVAHGVQPLAYEPPMMDDAPMVDEPPTSGFRFTGPATLRGHTPAPPLVKPPEPVLRPPVQDVDEVVARLLGKTRHKPQPE